MTEATNSGGGLFLGPLAGRAVPNAEHASLHALPTCSHAYAHSSILCLPGPGPPAQKWFVHACVAQDHNSSRSLFVLAALQNNIGERDVVSIVVACSAFVMTEDAQGQSPSRPWFAANAVNDRVTLLEQQMVAIRTKELQDVRTMIDSLVSRQNSITNIVDRLRQRTAQHHDALADVVESHEKIIAEHSHALVTLAAATDDAEHLAASSQSITDVVRFGDFDEEDVRYSRG